MRDNRGQQIGEYAILLGVVATAVLTTQVYLSRAVNGGLQAMGQRVLGTPGAPSGSSASQSTDRVREQGLAGVYRTDLDSVANGTSAAGSILADAYGPYLGYAVYGNMTTPTAASTILLKFLNAAKLSQWEQAAGFAGQMGDVPPPEGIDGVELDDDDKNGYLDITSTLLDKNGKLATSLNLSDEDGRGPSVPLSITPLGDYTEDELRAFQKKAKREEKDYIAKIREEYRAYIKKEISDESLREAVDSVVLLYNGTTHGTSMFPGPTMDGITLNEYVDQMFDSGEYKKEFGFLSKEQKEDKAFVSKLRQTLKRVGNEKDSLSLAYVNLGIYKSTDPIEGLPLRASDNHALIKTNYYDQKGDKVLERSVFGDYSLPEGSGKKDKIVYHPDGDDIGEQIPIGIDKGGDGTIDVKFASASPEGPTLDLVGTPDEHGTFQYEGLDTGGTYLGWRNPETGEWLGKHDPRAVQDEPVKRQPVVVGVDLDGNTKDVEAWVIPNPEHPGSGVLLRDTNNNHQLDSEEADPKSPDEANRPIEISEKPKTLLTPADLGYDQMTFQEIVATGRAPSGYEKVIGFIRSNPDAIPEGADTSSLSGATSTGQPTTGISAGSDPNFHAKPVCTPRQPC